MGNIFSLPSKILKEMFTIETKLSTPKRAVVVLLDLGKCSDGLIEERQGFCEDHSTS